MYDNILSNKDFEDLLAFREQIHDLSDQDFVKGALNLIVRIFGYQSLSFFHVNDKGDFYDPIHVHFGDKAIQDYTEHYFTKDPFYFKNLNSRFQFREVIALSEMIDQRQFSNTEYKEDFFKKYGFDNEIALYLKDGDKHIGAMGVMKFEDEGAFTDRDMALLDIITKIIAQRFAEHIKKNSRILTEEETMFYDSPIGMIILDEKYQLVNYNYTAGKCICDLNISHSGPISQGEINELLNNHREPNGQVQEAFSVGEFEFKFLKSISPVAGSSSYATHYLLYVTPNSSYKIFSKRIQEFGLTKREIEIIKLIGKGLTNNQISEVLYISPRTVRTHIDNIMTKTDSENRTAVLHKIGLISEYL